MDWKWATTIRGQVPRWAMVALGAVPILILIGLWFAVTWGRVEDRVISSTILPSPTEVLDKLPSLKDRDIGTHILASLRRVALAYLISLLLMLPLGILMGAFGSFRALFSPMVTAGSYVPLSTLVPLTIAWFGTGEKMKITFLALAYSIFLLPMIVKAIDSVSDVYLRTAYTLGARRWQVVFRVLVPVALPDLWHAMRLAFGVGWTYIVLAEVITLEKGLGALIQITLRREPREHVYVVILIITLIAWIVDFLWGLLGRFLFPYRRTYA